MPVYQPLPFGGFFHCRDTGLGLLGCDEVFGLGAGLGGGMGAPVAVACCMPVVWRMTGACQFALKAFFFCRGVDMCPLPFVFR